MPYLFELLDEPEPTDSEAGIQADPFIIDTSPLDMNILRATAFARLSRYMPS